jgi:phenylalanine-4-hydroxylase
MTGAGAVEQDWGAYTAQEHAIWRTLFHRQEKILAQRACDEFLDGIKTLGVAAESIPASTKC